jgi:peroxiredoxin Q/BCP
MKQIEVGEHIPDFSAFDHDGVRRSFSAQTMTAPAVFYFYPKDDTPGCTKEACSFRDAYADFNDVGVEVYGISADSVDDHQLFREAHRLPFVLLSDPNNAIREAFGVPRDLFGMLPGRVTYVVDASGVVRNVFNSQVNMQRHVDESLEVLKRLR